LHTIECIPVEMAAFGLKCDRNFRGETNCSDMKL